MARPNIITQYMNSPLPSLTEQKRKSYRPEPDEVDRLYHALNRCIFEKQLTQPEILLCTLKRAWGSCTWKPTLQRRGSWGKNGTWCMIHLSDKYYSPQWLVTTLAHEMVHQWQWDIYRWHHEEQYQKPMYMYSGAHGPSFYCWREAFAEWNIPLKISHKSTRWFALQDLMKV